MYPIPDLVKFTKNQSIIQEDHTRKENKHILWTTKSEGRTGGESDFSRKGRLEERLLVANFL